MSRLRSFAPVIGIASFFGLWELLVRVRHIGDYKLVKPSTALRTVFNSRSVFLREARPSVWAALVGFSIALSIAFVIGSLLAHSRVAERAVLPVALLIVVTPLFAYIQSVITWFGFGFRSLVVMVAIVCFPPFLFATVAGLRAIDPAAHELLRSVDASRWEVFRKLRVPSSLPYLFPAAKVSSGLALVGVTIGEPYAFIDHGLGLTIRRAAAAGIVAIPQLWGSIFVLGFIGSFAYLAISGVETVVRRWHNPSGANRNLS